MNDLDPAEEFPKPAEEVLKPPQEVPKTNSDLVLHEDLHFCVNDEQTLPISLCNLVIISCMLPYVACAGLSRITPGFHYDFSTATRSLNS